MAEAPAEPRRTPDGVRAGGRLQAVLLWTLLTALALHPTQITVRQWADALAQRLGFGLRAAGLIPAVGICVSDALFVVAFGLWLVAGRADGRLTSCIRRYPAALIALFGAVVLAAVPHLKPIGLLGGRTVAWGRAVQELVQLAVLLGCAYAVLADRLRDPAWRTRLTGAFLCGAFAAILIGVWDYGRLRPDATDPRFAVSPAQVDGSFGFAAEAAGPHEQAGTLSNRNVLGAWVSLAVPLLWGLALCVRRPPVRAACGVAAAAGMLLLLHAGLWAFTIVGVLTVAWVRGRQAFAATALALFVLWTAVFGFGPQRHGAVLLDSAMLRKSFDRFHVLPVYGGGRVPPQTEPAPLGSADNSVWQQRYVEWQAALQAVARSPLFGVGPGNYQVRVNRYYEPPPDRLLNPGGVYNVSKPSANLMEAGGNAFYLVWLTETGLVGVLGLLSVLLFGLHGAVRSYCEGEDDLARGLALGAFGALCAAAGGMAFTHYLVRGVGIAFAFVLACASQRTGRPAPQA
ncbi:MAG: hypothetical protein GXY85_06795 [Candidatus Brocadiaceae bacterium]|nr:hypothetical protein [Candidatus Brocadiaceae bacterium]